MSHADLHHHHLWLPHGHVHPPRAPGTLPDWTTLAAFGLVALFGGAAAIAVRESFTELTPFWSAAFRFGPAGLLLWVWVLVRRIPIPRGQALLGAVIYGVFTFGFFPLFLYWGFVKTPITLTTTLIALTPLLTLLLASLQGQEAITWRGIFGAAMALIGISIAVSANTDVHPSLIHLLSIFLGVACGSEAGVIARRFPRNDPYATNAIGMTAGAIVLIAAALISGEPFHLPQSASVLLALGYLVIFASIGMFTAYLHVLLRWSASAASYAPALVPVVSAVLVTLLASEHITGGMALGGAFALSGVFVGALLPKPTIQPKKTP